MNRRKLITLLGGAAATWPVVARAQPADKVKLVTVMMVSEADDPSYQARIVAFQQRLQDFGWTDGRNIRIHYSWVGRDTLRMRAAAKELVKLEPNVIVTTNTVSTQMVQQVTDTLSIVFAGGTDPLASGLVASLAHPGRNVTGFSNFEFSLGAKWLELLRQVAPGTKRVLVLTQPANDGNRGLFGTIQTAASALAVKLSTADVNDAIALERAVTEFSREPDGGLIILPLPSHTRDLILALAVQHKLPAIYPLRRFTQRGGLMSYGYDELQLWRGAASYVDKILRGEKPGDLPVQHVTKFELVLNLKTAKALGLRISDSFLLLVDEVIE